jgi:NADH-quinone oxidoreductase subunit F
MNNLPAELVRRQAAGRAKLVPAQGRIAVGLGTCGTGMGADQVYQTLQTMLGSRPDAPYLAPVGCFGFCAREPLVSLVCPGRPLLMLSEVQPADATALVQALATGDLMALPPDKILCRIPAWDHLTGTVTYGSGYPQVPTWDQVPFFAGQQKIVLRNCGLINPEDIDEYLAVGGYQSLHRALQTLTPEQVVAEVSAAGLRGRGGAGFPTGKKWEIMRQRQSERKYIIGNADEGDPGAYMNRNEMESDPHMLLEGMLIGAYAMGAREGIIYIRAEYPLAVRRLRAAVAQAADCGLLGQNILGAGFDFNLHIVEGAGAFVCGEETAMIASLSGMPGRARPRPPYPAQAGYRGAPTTINNVETWGNIPVILSKGGEWFARIGSAHNTGTKVFSLVGKVRNTGLAELPLGTPLGVLVNDIGAGCDHGKRTKAVQTGGPSGGCIPTELFHTPMDYESLAALGAIMGSGGVVVMDEDDCMVDTAHYFTSFLTDESCGKCAPCRLGTHQLSIMLNHIVEGRGRMEHLELLEELAGVMRDTALCALGRTAPNPVLTTLKFFRDEYLQHIRDRVCPAKECKALFNYQIKTERCSACGKCRKSCPQNAISGAPGVMHIIMRDICNKCGLCGEVCPVGAVEKV